MIKHEPVCLHEVNTILPEAHLSLSLSLSRFLTLGVSENKMQLYAVSRGAPYSLCFFKKFRVSRMDFSFAQTMLPATAAVAVAAATAAEAATRHESLKYRERT